MENAELLSYFNENQFVPDLRTKTKNGAITKLADLLVTNGVVANKALLIDMLHRRETVGSTGIGHGIGIPHGRTMASDVLSVVFGKSKKGIEWGAIDDEPVHLIFLIVAPPHDDKNEYLPMLGKLVEFLNADENRLKLMESKNFEEFKQAFSS